jgi:DNA anti-recombination protein RmuC
MRIRLLTCCTFCLAALLGAAVTAQDKPANPARPEMTAAARLQALLLELGTTDAKVWAERVAALEQAAVVQEQEARRLREQATSLQQQATQKDARRDRAVAAAAGTRGRAAEAAAHARSQARSRAAEAGSQGS